MKQYIKKVLCFWLLVFHCGVYRAAESVYMGESAGAASAGPATAVDALVQTDPSVASPVFKQEETASFLDQVALSADSGFFTADGKPVSVGAVLSGLEKWFEHVFGQGSAFEPFSLKKILFYKQYLDLLHNEFEKYKHLEPVRVKVIKQFKKIKLEFLFAKAMYLVNFGLRHQQIYTTASIFLKKSLEAYASAKRNGLIEDSEEDMYIKTKQEELRRILEEEDRRRNRPDYVPVVQRIPEHYFRIRTLSDWADACKRLEYNRSDAFRGNTYSGANIGDVKNNGLHQAGLKTADERAQEFLLALYLYADQKNEQLCISSDWINGSKPLFKFDTVVQNFLSYSATGHTPLDYAYVQKQIIEQGSQCYMHGDYHGDIISLITMLEELKRKGTIDDHFKIVDPKVYLIFLGDYVDRGSFGLEVLYTVLRLAVTNPEQVILVRGNHETSDMNYRYGFLHEIGFKLTEGYKGVIEGGSMASLHALISSIYNYMPLAFYLGCNNTQGGVNYIQCCHGGLDVQYNDAIKQFLAERVASYVALPNCTDMSGFLWTDFNPDVLADESTRSPRGESIMCYNQFDTEMYLSEQSSPGKHIYLQGIIRGHQHAADATDHLMSSIIQSKGIFKMWKRVETAVGDEQHRIVHDGIVWTTNVAPDSIYGYIVNFDFDTYIKVIPEPLYNNWKMFVYNNIIPNLKKVTPPEPRARGGLRKTVSSLDLSNLETD